MTCAEVERHLDAFVDGELPSAALVDVARHASGCAACDEAVRRLAVLQQCVASTAESDAASLDLSGVWRAVETGIERDESRATWTRRLGAAPWAAAFALAAGALFWVRAASGPVEATRVAAQPRRNQAVIERLDSEARIELRRERKNGTTLIMVSDDGGEAAR